jgi:RNA polymerase sigma-70 factor (ECF subfamily)
MGTLMDNNSAQSVDLIERARAGDREALNALFARHRDRLCRMVEMRLDTRLQARLDASDVVQEAYVDVTERLEEYLRDPKLPLFLWLRLVVGERLLRLHRHHLGTQMRDAGREVSLYRGAMPQASSESLAARLLGRFTSASEVAVRAERQLKLQQALNGMDPIDREVIGLRHFEELSNSETAQVLGLSKAAASNRYVRAMTRLQAVLEHIPGLLDRPDE